ncbi:MAG: hypothetical protein ACREDS_03290, partial [Limisphaerales bacterium]
MRGITHQFRLDNARCFLLFFPNEILSQLVGSLKFIDAERFPAIRQHITETKAQIIAPSQAKLAMLPIPPFFNFENHDCLRSS